jgi:hypothetical protein
MNRIFSLSQESRLQIVACALIAVVGFHYYSNQRAHTATPVMSDFNRAEIVYQWREVIPARMPDRYIAHAAGRFAGATYTNSIEALEANYAAGYRTFEVDINLTTDDQLVLLHDWEATMGNLYGLPPGQRDLATLRAETVGWAYHAATVDDLVAWMNTRPDAYIVLDTKVPAVPALARISQAHPQLRDRFIPFIYTFGQYGPVRQLGFHQITLLAGENQYRPSELYDFARVHPMYAVALLGPSYCAEMTRLGRIVPVYCGTLDDPAVARGLMRDAGLYGVITNQLLP